ncbi:MAG: HlyD family type I secretion periplasmic adaptor subunit [Pseudomonadota bacterium]
MGRRNISLKPLFVSGFFIIGAVFGGLVAWSVFAPFEGAVLASGTIAVEGNRKAVQHLEGGIVSEINVREGDYVEAGQVILRLDGTATRAQLAALEARLSELASREARLLAEQNGSRTMTIRPELADLAERPSVQSSLEGQASLRRARTESRASQARIMRQRMSQLQTRIDGSQNEIAAKRSELSLVEQEAQSLAGLRADGLVTETRMLELERAQFRLRGELEALNSAIATTRVQIGETELELQRLEAGFLEEVVMELRDVKAEIAELYEQRIASIDRLKRLDIVAPTEGYAIGVRAHTEGGVITPSEPVLFVVPRDDRLVAKIRINPADIDKITVGQDARLIFSAFAQTESPEVNGAIVTVSADAITDDASGLQFYEAIVEWPREAPEAARFDLLPGMPVEAMVKTESRNVLSYLVKPFQDAMSRTFRE